MNVSNSMEHQQQQNHHVHEQLQAGQKHGCQSSNGASTSQKASEDASNNRDARNSRDIINSRDTINSNAANRSKDANKGRDVIKDRKSATFMTPATSEQQQDVGNKRIKGVPARAGMSAIV
jgi:hypothetical protein